MSGSDDRDVMETVSAPSGKFADCTTSDSVGPVLLPPAFLLPLPRPSSSVTAVSKCHTRRWVHPVWNRWRDKLGC